MNRWFILKIRAFHTTVLLWCIFHLSPLYKQGSILSFGCGAATMLPVHLPSCLFLRNLYEHMQRGCSLVPFWHPEVWAEVRLLDVWRLVAGPPDERCWHLKLHAQWRMGPNRWVWWNFFLFFYPRQKHPVAEQTESISHRPYSSRGSRHQKRDLLWLL